MPSGASMELEDLRALQHLIEYLFFVFSRGLVGSFFVFISSPRCKGCTQEAEC